MVTNSVVTVFRCQRDEDEIVCLGTVPAWVEKEEIIKNENAGVYQDDSITARILIRHLSDIRIGDLVFFGRAESACAEISECHRISSLKKNSFGINPHWLLRVEYRYR